MILVTGGIASGKRTYVRSLGYDDGQMDKRLAGDACVLVGLEELLRAGELGEADVDALARKDVVVCCEVGQGVVPMEAEERVWRERVGRTCASLAQRASKVVRMVCGIPLVIKEER
ncbi:MAG: bifunctional adenosylcobinamide kinase/adenosylcobinamide-phosphate guanylyltransferase [Atopobiaceae bacterium]|nr:bifunctional adenosylcobinamide kinase/adenosylcobinamide-phosphate guanylyltransferase [Atopobiaceae bacterium]